MQERSASEWPHMAAAIQGWLDELAAGGVLVTDADLRIRAWNHWLELHSGHRAADIIGTPLFDLYPELATRGLDQYYRDALAGEVRVVAQRFHGYLLPLPTRAERWGDHTPDGLMPQSARIAPVRLGDRVIGTLTVVENVAERVISERELRNQIAALERSRATAEAAVRTKDEFLATLSHELRTPLNAVLGWTRLLRAGQLDAATTKRALEVIDRNATAQADLIDDLLDIARIMQGKLRLEMQPADIVPVVLAAADVVRPAAEAKSLVLTTDIEPDCAIVVGDTNRLQQVAWNLLSNAVKFTPTGGTVGLRVRVRGELVDLIVHDTGKGISPEFLPHVFDRFRQEDSTSTRRFGGLGLGLALVRQIVELHGGNTKVQSAGEGQGATFTVTLPLRSPVVTPSASHRQDSEDAESARLAGRRVLIVEDDHDTRDLLSSALARHGAFVTAVATASEGYATMTATRHDERPDLIVADIGLPAEDGYGLIERVRALLPEAGGRVPAIAVTGYGSPADRERALAAGFDLHFTKPVDLSVLANAAVQLLVDRRR